MNLKKFPSCTEFLANGFNINEDIAGALSNAASKVASTIKPEDIQNKAKEVIAKRDMSYLNKANGIIAKYLNDTIKLSDFKVKVDELFKDSANKYSFVSKINSKSLSKYYLTPTVSYNNFLKKYNKIFTADKSIDVLKTYNDIKSRNSNSTIPKNIDINKLNTISDISSLLKESFSFLNEEVNRPEYYNFDRYTFSYSLYALYLYTNTIEQNPEMRQSNTTTFNNTIKPALDKFIINNDPKVLNTPEIINFYSKYKENAESSVYRNFQGYVMDKQKVADYFNIFSSSILLNAPTRSGSTKKTDAEIIRDIMFNIQVIYSHTWNTSNFVNEIKTFADFYNLFLKIIEYKGGVNPLKNTEAPTEQINNKIANAFFVYILFKEIDRRLYVNLQKNIENIIANTPTITSEKFKELSFSDITKDMPEVNPGNANDSETMSTNNFTGMESNPPKYGERAGPIKVGKGK